MMTTQQFTRSSVALAVFAVLTAVSVGTYAADVKVNSRLQTEGIDDGENFSFIGDVAPNGNPRRFSEPGNPQSSFIPTDLFLTQNENVNRKTFYIEVAKVDENNGDVWKDTSECMVINSSRTPELTITEQVTMINRVQTTNPDNLDNNGLVYITDNRKVNFDVTGDIYMAAVGGNEKRNLSTVATVKDGDISISGQEVQLIGSIDFKHRKDADKKYIGHAQIKLNGENSFWYGRAVNILVPEQSYVDLTLSNGATWIYDPRTTTESPDPDGGMKIQKLTLEKGVVLLDDEMIAKKYGETLIRGTDKSLSDYRDTSLKNKGVKIAELRGSGGVFQMDLNWQSNQGRKTNTESSDFIEISSVMSDGSQQLVVFDPDAADLDQMKPGEKLYFASVENGETAFTTSIDGVEVASSAELYDFRFTTKNEVITEDANKKTYWYLDKATGGANENVTALRSFGRVSYAVASQLNRFNDRIADASAVRSKADGAWVRYNYRESGFDNEFELDSHLLQVGYGLNLSDSQKGRYLSAYMDYEQNNVDITGISGDGDLDRYAFNLSYSLVADCGGYADFVVRGGNLRADYDLRNRKGELIGASVHQNYFGLSTEIGYKIDMQEKFFVEPQLQVQYTRIAGEDVTTDGGIRARLHSIDSVIGRAGIRSGYRFTSTEGLLYSYADVLREFRGSSQYDAFGQTSSRSEEIDGKQTWFDLGIGFSQKLNNNADLWIDSKYLSGGDFKDSWNFTAGVRWNFL